MEPVVRIQNLSKEFRHWENRPASFKTVLVNLVRGRFDFGNTRHVTVLEDICIDVHPGDFVGIMGRNGAGKSTLMKLIAGIYTPTSGSINVRGVIAPLIELGAGFHPDLSGYENIFLNAAILGFGRTATLKAVASIIDFSELGEMIHMPVKNYSSGMVLRLGFSVATHLEAPILLIDEILAVGDAGFQKKCLTKIRELHERGRTIILITHDAEAVRNNCTRCVVLSDARKTFDGSVDPGVTAYLELNKGGGASIHGAEPGLVDF